jgi:hypothetical protein
MTPSRSTVLSVALLAVSLGSIVSVVQATRPALVSNGDSLGIVVASGPACPTTVSTPSAVLDIPAAPPAGSVPAGSALSVTYQLQALSLPSGLSSASVELPSVTGIFPESTGGSFDVFTNAQTVSVTEGAWTAVTAHSKSVTSTTEFTTGPSAELSTQLLAVLTTAPAGSLNLEVRWSWSLDNGTGSTSTGAWTVPATNGTFPSIFFPDPYVALVGQSPSVEQTGAFFSVQLSGAPSHTQFLLKLENDTTGATLNRAWFNSSYTADAAFTGSIQLASGSVALPPGTYLVHVHDNCAGILYNLPVEVGSVVSAAEPPLGLASRHG